MTYEARLMAHYAEVKRRLRTGRRPTTKAEAPLRQIVEAPRPPSELTPKTQNGPHRSIVREAIFRVVEDDTAIDRSWFLSRRKTKSLVEARRLICWLADHFDPEMSARQIGKWIGSREHTTVWHCLDTARRRCRIDEAYASRLETLADRVRERLP